MMTRPKHKVTSAVRTSPGSNFDKDGRFRIDDVTPGIYELSVSVNAKPNPEAFDPGECHRLGPDERHGARDPRRAIGRAARPGDDHGQALRDAQGRRPAPDFTVPRIAGKGKGDQLRLGDYQASSSSSISGRRGAGLAWPRCPRSRTSRRPSAAIRGSSLISLSCDETAEGAEQYIKENGLIWTHGFAGNLLAGANAGTIYKVRAIPATFLIGPDGRILAKNLRGAELKEAVRKALADPDLFPAATRATQQPGSP